MPAYGIGSVILKAELVDENGTVLASDRVRIKSDVSINSVVDLFYYLEQKWWEYWWDIIWGSVGFPPTITGEFLKG